jgi:hypothetical protein
MYHPLLTGKYWQVLNMLVKVRLGSSDEHNLPVFQFIYIAALHPTKLQILSVIALAAILSF